MKYLLPLILIIVAIAALFMFTVPMYNDIKLLSAEGRSYNEALGNSKALENERDKLTAKYNAFNKEDIDRLEKMLPENVDNIRLILEIEQLATPYGMALRNVQYNKAETSNSPQGGIAGPGIRPQRREEYGTFDLEFTTSGSYTNFMSFIRDLENNLRLVDVYSVAFSSNIAPSQKTAADVYEYNVKIRTYWLKN
jgi:Tfp pilus assembly protein PilO